MSKCLVCFEELTSGEYHSRCSMALFGTKQPMQLAMGVADLPAEGIRLLEDRRAIAGVQKKLSLGRDAEQPQRLTVVGFQGRFILKPPSSEYLALPENEALTMELASRLGLPVAAHGLVRLNDGEFGYLSRRFDRPNEGVRWHQEDFCQLAERPAADKYKGSLEAAGKLLRFSRQTGLDAVRFLELNLFCWLTGNADMHLKNFSLLHYPEVGWSLSPAYDLVSTALVLTDDTEETALPLNGKKAKLNRKDWAVLAASLGVEAKTFARLAVRLASQTELVAKVTQASWLPELQKEEFIRRYEQRAVTLG